MKKTIVALAVFACVIVSGCASVLSESNYPVRINSNPTGANFVIQDRSGAEVASGMTPEVVTLSAGAGFFTPEQYTIKYTSTSGEEKTVTMKATMDGWYLGNILFGGLPGLLIIDPATGAMWRLPKGRTVNFVDATMPTATSLAGEELITVVSIDQIPVADRIGLVPVN